MTAVLSRLIVIWFLSIVVDKPVPPIIVKSESIIDIKLLSTKLDTRNAIDVPPVIPSTYPLVAASATAVGVATFVIRLLLTPTVPVPLGRRLMLPLEFVALILLLFISILSTSNLSILPSESTIRALLIVSVPGVWSSLSVKNLPPITSIVRALPLADSPPVPINNLSTPSA